MERTLKINNNLSDIEILKLEFLRKSKTSTENTNLIFKSNSRGILKMLESGEKGKDIISDLEVEYINYDIKDSLLRIFDTKDTILKELEDFELEDKDRFSEERSRNAELVDFREGQLGLFEEKMIYIIEFN